MKEAFFSFFSLPGDVYLRIFISAVVGFLIGYERTSKNKPAGIRTYSFVCMGSTLVMIISIYGVEQVVGSLTLPKQSNVVQDPMRLASQVVSGLGFLGGGLILKYGKNIKGLTSAAQLWATGMIGLAIGANLLDVVLMVMVAMYLVIKISSYLEKRGFLPHKTEEEEHD
ncbi:MgtC/SapB family protein [Microaerobacter geothermalis]|uniref:MgtC/SapB family protein n=1 Tax=Microaerobacter geothermalis TaxID=674972 RepID=UPI001F24C28C|nr:MgtC/SapB family protein [Microaerobacter geothermalis]MCF6093703.1 MgtC/SapB family protein [Microaerobacter geothermalis]